MKRNPRVSVVMAVHNGEPYLRQSLDSVVAQTLEDWELIAVDDGSTDQTPGILDEYATGDGRLVVIHQENRGQTRALNRGLSKVRSQYVARLDADDVALPERLRIQVAYLDQHKGVGLVGSSVKLIDETGNAYCTLISPAGDAELRRMLIRGNPFVHSTVMFRREVLEEVGLYDPAIQLGQDYDLWMRMSRVSQLANVPQPLVHLRKHAKNITHTHRRQQARGMLAVQLRAIALGWYPLWCIIYIWRPLIHVVMPEFSYQLVLQHRRRYYRGIVRNRF